MTLQKQPIWVRNMLLNKILFNIQNLLSVIYKNSYFLQNIDKLIFVNILLVILMSGFASSDMLGYFAISSILLTFIKLITKPNEKIYLSVSDKFLLIYFLTVLVSVAGSSLLMLSFKGFIKTLTYIGFYLSFINYLKDNRKNLKYFLMAIGIVVIGESIVAIKQNFMSVSEISGWQDVSHLNPEEVMTRVYGALKPYNPNLFGGYMLSALPATLVFVFLPLANKHFKTALCGFGIFLLSIISILLTGCRGAYIGLFFQLILLSLVTYKFLKPYYKKLFSILISFLVVASSVIFLSVSSLRARVLSIFAMRSDSSNSFRFNVYHSSLDMFKDNWLLGIGVGNQNFREIYGLYMKTGFDALSSYNIYLETAVESGIFALISFIGFIGVNISRALHYVNKRRNVNSLYLVIALASLIGILIHGFVDTVFFRPQIQFIFWIMIGIIRVITVPRR